MSEPMDKNEIKKAKGSVVGKKRLLAFVLALCMVLMAAGAVKLLALDSDTDAFSIRWEDWLEKRSYADSVTLALQARSDLSAVLNYVQLKQAMEETDGSLDLDRPVLAAVLTDNSIGIYTMGDMLEMGEEMGLYVYEGMTDWGTSYTMNPEDGEQIQEILWSLFDYETNMLNRDTISFSYGETEPWDLRIREIEEAVSAAEEALRKNPDAYRYRYEAQGQEEASVQYSFQADADDGDRAGFYSDPIGQQTGDEASSVVSPAETEAEPQETMASADSEEEVLVSYTMAAKEPISLAGYCVRFLNGYLQPYYIWKEQFSAEESNLHWMLCLEKDQEFIIYGDPAVLQGEVTAEQLDAIYHYDSRTKTLVSTFSDQIDMVSFGNIKSSLIFDYDRYTFWLGLQTEALEQEWDAYGQTAAYYTQYRNQALTSGILIGAGLLVFVVVFIWLTLLSGRQDGKKEIRLNAYDRLPTEIGLTGVCVLLWLAGWDVYIGGNLLHDMYRYDIDSPLYHMGFLACLVCLVILCCLLLWLGWYGLVRRCKAHTIWRNSLVRYLLVWIVGLVRRICRWIGSLIHRGVDLFHKAGDRWWKTLGLFAVYLLGNFFMLLLLVSVRNVLIPLLALLVWNGGTAYLMLCRTAQRRQVQNGINRIASGDIDYQLPLEGLTGDSYEMAAAINSIRGGLKNAVEEKVKNERMRTELITNVSHDIKTPLTSIINYVDLLKRQNIDDPKVQEYLNILEKKAERLRILTEDLVEASKASSGALKLKEEEIDFVELVNQTNGEFSDRFGRCNLKLICSMPDHPVYILADGRYVWRILENLYRNVEKYALSGTRVYVEVTQKGNRICFVIKNISATELNIRAEELTERFIRGDASRTTEGSGLGLSIARDLTRLMNGTFQIYLDGDLFRVTVSFVVHE